jgi:hypothetical protein
VKRHELYGWRPLALREASEHLAAATGATFALHDSDYLGGDYFLGEGPNGERISVQENFADDEGYLMEPDFPDHATLVYVSGTDTGTGWALDREGFELLRSDLTS